MAYRLPSQTPTIGCLDYLKDGGIADRLCKRRDNFVETNKACAIIRHSETLKHSQGRRIRIKKHHKDRSVRNKGWKTVLHEHREHIFFSDLNNDPSQEDKRKNTQSQKCRKTYL